MKAMRGSCELSASCPRVVSSYPSFLTRNPRDYAMTEPWLVEDAGGLKSSSDRLSESTELKCRFGVIRKARGLGGNQCHVVCGGGRWLFLGKKVGGCRLSL
jgi:hypothetical protein